MGLFASGEGPERQAGIILNQVGYQVYAAEDRPTMSIFGDCGMPAGGLAGASGGAAEFAQGGYLVLHRLLEFPAPERGPQDGIGLVAKQAGMGGSRG